MALRRVGRKTVDVLVDGAQQGSFTQDVDRADYDVSVSSSPVWTGKQVAEVHASDTEYANPATDTMPDDGYANVTLDYEAYSYSSTTVTLELRDASGSTIWSYSKSITGSDSGTWSWDFIGPSLQTLYVDIGYQDSTIDAVLTGYSSVDAQHTVDGVTQIN